MRFFYTTLFTQLLDDEIRGSNTLIKCLLETDEDYLSIFYVTLTGLW